MTEEQKEILIARMLDAPSSLSDEELDSILHDDELRDIYDASAALSSACIPKPEFDMKAEWSNFRPRIRRKPSPLRWVMRVAAIFLGVIVVSGITGRIIDKVFSGEQASVIAKAEQPKDLQITPAKPSCQQVNAVEEEIEEKPTTVRRHSAVDRHLLSKAETNQSSSVAAHVESEIDVDEYLRIQQARIDNDLAMQVAESCLDEYDDIVGVLDAVGAYSPALDNVIIKVTME